MTMETQDMTLNVRTDSTERDTEVTILHITSDGMYAVVDGRALNKNFPYPTYHIGKGLRVPGNEESYRTRDNAKRFADEFAAMGWFNADGKPLTADSEQRHAMVVWARDWSPS